MIACRIANNVSTFSSSLVDHYSVAVHIRALRVNFPHLHHCITIFTPRNIRCGDPLTLSVSIFSPLQLSSQARHDHLDAITLTRTISRWDTHHACPEAFTAG